MIIHTAAEHACRTSVSFTWILARLSSAASWPVNCDPSRSRYRPLVNGVCHQSVTLHLESYQLLRMLLHGLDWASKFTSTKAACGLPASLGNCGLLMIDRTPLATVEADISDNGCWSQQVYVNCRIRCNHWSIEWLLFLLVLHGLWYKLIKESSEQYILYMGPLTPWAT